MSQTVKFKRIEGNRDLPLPAYETAGAAGMDLRAFLPDGPVTLAHDDLELISIGFCMELPLGTEMQIRSRSSMALKKRILIPNAPATIDSDYRGEVKVGLYNFGKDPVTISHGDRIAQGVIAAVLQVETAEADDLTQTGRGAGGFGSTGVA